METNLRRTGNFGSQCIETYEFEYLVNLKLLADLTKNYLAVYGEDLTDEKLNRLVIELLHGFMTGTRCTQSHRWMSKFFVEGIEFIELFEKEATGLLNSNINNWRDFEPECIHISVESHLASTFIGFKHMLPHVNRTLMDTHNGLDTYIGQRMNPIFEQEILLDFSNSMYHEVGEIELVSLANGRITWAYLIEECMRVNSEVHRLNLHPCQITPQVVVQYLDIDELRTRYENSPMMSRLLMVEDIRAAEAIFDDIILGLAGIVTRILYSNTEILHVVTEQLIQRLKAMNYPGLVSFHCISFQWMNRAGIAKFGAFPTVPDNLQGTIGVL